ncbi:MAG: hypothetical protein EA379_10620 [Phycisphaerales bacterium]|nr:MAG: hypothetical protein EA379_10620 [Phycisphaerales bacterium]
MLAATSKARPTPRRRAIAAAALFAGALALPGAPALGADASERLSALDAAAIEAMIEIVAHDNEDASTRLRLAAMLERVGERTHAAELVREAAAIDEALRTHLERPDIEACQTCDRSTGADVILGDINGIANYGFDGDLADGVSAYAVGTTSCNIGDEIMSWNDEVHPVIAQNMHRIKDGRFEQIGMSWLKHGFCALQQNLCGPCEGPAGCPQVLYPNCSDPYSAGLNGTQSLLGPRWEVNPSAGTYVLPFDSPPIENNLIDRRLQVRNADVAPEHNPGALYFVEGIYIHLEDAQAGNALNNASYRRVNINLNGQQTQYRASFVVNNPTRVGLPAVYAWQEYDPEVRIDIVDIPDEGGEGMPARILIATRVSEIEDDVWRYVYAIQNLNSDRGVRAFRLPSPGLADSGYTAEFHAPDYHSGDGVDGVTIENTPWEFTPSTGVAAWATENYSENPNANALRWGTVYTFTITTPGRPPEEGDCVLGLFKPGAGPASLAVSLPAPGGCFLAGDVTGDGEVGFDDLSEVLSGFGETYGFEDLSAVLATFGASC